jgi:ribonuclease P protein component
LKFTLTKNERLSSKKQIEKLFKEGKSYFSYPFRVIYLFNDGQEEHETKILLTVSKKKFKKAVDRNRIKRIIREAFRKNKMILNDYLQENNKSLWLGLIYTGETIPSYQEAERKLILILQRLIKQGETDGSSS